MSNLTEYAKSEFSRLRKVGEEPDEMQQQIEANILELLEVFSNQGHSGFSGSYALARFMRLANFKPLAPLIGEDSEWGECTEGLYQNKRCSAVFKDALTGKVYNIGGKVFSDDSGESWFTSKDSRVPVVFPYIVPEEPERVFLKTETKADRKGEAIE